MQLRKVSDTIQQLAETSKHLATVYKIGRSTDLSDVYKDLQQMLEKWSKYMKGQSKTASECLEEYSYYGTLESNSLRELNTRRQAYSNTFMKAEQTLLKKKQRLLKQDPSRWELSSEWANRIAELRADKKLAMENICYKETAMVKKLRENHIFMSNQSYAELS